jgi:two-component system, OmpR family, sensor histidine kinase MprB
MTLRTKLVLALAALAVVATIGIGVTTYNTTRAELNRAIDRSLDVAARQVSDRPYSAGERGPRPPLSSTVFEQVLVQRIDTDGNVLVSSLSRELPVSEADLTVAGDPGERVRRDVTIDGGQYRALTVGTTYGATQLMRSTEESAEALDRIRRNTLVAVIVVGVLAGGLGWLIARQVTRRLAHLADAASTVAASGRLDVAVPTDGRDETGHLGRAFKGMLDALEHSREQQQQLVEDAGHELRTPLTSLRTNVAVLRRFDSLDPESRSQLLDDLDSESRELTELVDELVELATDRRDGEEVERRGLGELAERAAERTRRRTGQIVTVRDDATIVEVRPAAIERAIQNLVDNAAKFAPGTPVEVTVEGRSLTVRDHGPGIPAEDLPHVFDRFYRSVRSRSVSGSGLGLAIVKSIVELHGGTVWAANAADGGAVVGFRLP